MKRCVLLCDCRLPLFGEPWLVQSHTIPQIANKGNVGVEVWIERCYNIVHCSLLCMWRHRCRLVWVIWQKISTMSNVRRIMFPFTSCGRCSMLLTWKRDGTRIHYGEKKQAGGDSVMLWAMLCGETWVLAFMWVLIVPNNVAERVHSYMITVFFNGSGTFQ